MDDKTFFDKIAPTWDENEVLSTSEKVNGILDLMDIKMGQRILDLGTGTGVLLPFLTERIGKKGQITAVDFSSGMLDIAKRKFQNLSPAPLFLNLDFENETIPGEYDRIILYCVYPHLHEPIETLKWLKNVNLKPGGKIFIAFPCGPDFINNIHKEKKSESHKLPSASSLKTIICESGLKAEVKGDDDNTFLIEIS